MNHAIRRRATVATLSLSLLVTGSALTASPAQANPSTTGYVCYVAATPMNAIDDGVVHVSFSLYSGPACSGSFYGVYVLDRGNSYSSTVGRKFMLSMFERLIDAAADKRSIYVPVTARYDWIAAGIGWNAS